MDTIHDLDVLVVGAGLSGVGAAYRLATRCPTRSFVVLEGRADLGGTWDLFRYPGVRSDSDMYTLGYPFHPWKAGKVLADGPSILAYIRETAERFDLLRHLRFRHHVVAARWSSAEARWTVEVEVGEERHKELFRCRFLYLCSGYYSYEAAHEADLPGLDRFAGRVVHPQWWPQDLDYRGKRVLVVGSGATAITIVPAMAEEAAHVTMLQRSPTYVWSLPTRDPVADVVRKALPGGVAHRLVRGKNVLLTTALYQFCRRFPRAARQRIQAAARRQLPAGYPVDPDFNPRYEPWDERLCVVPSGDLFAAISSGKASVVTDRVETFTEGGVRLASGRQLEADLVVTATGLRLVACGGIRLEVDGAEVDPADRLAYKGLMLSGVPNLAICIGYTNASWTLRADLSSRYVCRLLRHMERHGYDVAVAEPVEEVERRPLLDLRSGYARRSAALLPKQGTKGPWVTRQNYLLDMPAMRFGRVDGPEMRFSRAGAAG